MLYVLRFLYGGYLTHFGHDNIIRYCKRPFTSSDEMDEKILANFNSVLRPGDVLYHLGDVSWSSFPLERFFNRLNTNQVHLIWGNHDKPKQTVHPSFRSYSDIKNIHIEKRKIVLCHYSLQTWNGKGRGAYHLFGHSHGNLAGVGRSMDVGVDTNNFFPYSYEEVRDKMEKIPFDVYD